MDQRLPHLPSGRGSDCTGIQRELTRVLRYVSQSSLGAPQQHLVIDDRVAIVVLEHEIHHKAQLAVYVRMMGLVAPFYAMPMPPGARPDIAAREQIQHGE